MDKIINVNNHNATLYDRYEVVIDVDPETLKINKNRLFLTRVELENLIELIDTDPTPYPEDYHR